MDSISAMASLSGGGGQDLHAAALQHADSAKMLRASSSTRSTVRPTRVLVGLMQPLEHALLFRGQVGDDAVQEQRGFIEQPLRRFDAFDHDAARHGVQLRVLVPADNSRPVNTTTGMSRQRLRRRACTPAPRSRSYPAGAGRARRNRRLHGCSDIERLLARCGADDLDVIVPEQFADAQLLGVIVFHDQQTLAARLREVLDPRERFGNALACRWAW